MRVVRAVLLALVITLGPAVVPAAAPASAAATLAPVAVGSLRADHGGLPSRRQWLRQVRKRLDGSRAFVGRRVRHAQRPLALNLDIDNTSLATHYQPGVAVRPVLRLARYAARRGVAVLFNTGRAAPTAEDAAATVAELQAAGFPVDGVCHRAVGERLVTGKQRCRAEFAAAGYVVIANVGNRLTDFQGTGYERAYRLPGYRKQLG